jgi:predicted RNA-binding protein with PUA domain
MSSTTIALDKNSLLFERKLETVTEGLTEEFHNLFNSTGAKIVILNVIENIHKIEPTTIVYVENLGELLTFDQPKYKC